MTIRAKKLAAKQDIKLVMKKSSPFPKKKSATSGVTAVLAVPNEPLTEAFHVEEDPGARGTHGSPGREEIRKTTHRVMGSRQSQKPVERSGQPRKKRG
jgi:hypothetical protein